MDTALDNSPRIVEQAFRSVRPLILSQVGTATSTHKTDGSPVTDIDVETERLIAEFIRARFPELPVFGEETGYNPDNLPETCWLIDPIDGTKSYLKNIPAFTCMGVLIHEQQVRASVIYDPTTDAMFSAQAGTGAYKNGQKIDLANTPLPKQVFCKQQDIEVLETLLKDHGIKVKVAPSGGGFGFTQVADGTAAARFHLHSGTNIHDHAPGALLIKEAGGDVIPLFEPEYSYRSQRFVACHPALSDFVRQHLDTIRSLEEK